MEEIDRKILILLSQDGRMSFTDLARQTGLSVSATHQRVRRLERRGLIQGYAAVINPADAGLPLTAFVSIKPFDPAAPDVAYLPALHESCGLDVESMYALLHQLESARLIDLEGAYPFQDVKLRYPELRDYVRIAAERKQSLHEALGDLRLDPLDR